MTRAARWLFSVIRQHPSKSFTGLRSLLGWARSALIDALALLYHRALIVVRPVPEPEWGTVAHRVWAAETAPTCPTCPRCGGPLTDLTRGKWVCQRCRKHL